MQLGYLRERTCFVTDPLSAVIKELYRQGGFAAVLANAGGRHK